MRNSERLLKVAALFLSIAKVIELSLTRDWVKVVVVEMAQTGHFLIGRLSLIEQQLDLGLKKHLLGELTKATSSQSVLLTV